MESTLDATLESTENAAAANRDGDNLSPHGGTKCPTESSRVISRANTNHAARMAPGMAGVWSF